MVPGGQVWAGAAVIVRHTGQTGSVRLPLLLQDAVVEQANRLLNDHCAVQPVCAWLWQAVIKPLLADARAILAGASEWVFVPLGHTGALPLHAAGSPGSGWVDEQVSVRTVPSLLALAPTPGPDPSRAAGAPVVAVSDAVDLKFLPADRAAALALILEATELVGEVSPDAVLTRIVEAPVVVLSGHAVHSLAEGGGLHLGRTSPDPQDREGSGEGVDRWLTAEAVDRLPLRDRDYVFLSACSSGQTATDLPDEAIGLPSSFLHAGFATVIATAWPVADFTAFVTLTRFLQLRAHNPEQGLVVTMRATRTWLRTLSRQGLLAWIERDLPALDLPPELFADLRDEALVTCEEHPFADPWHWGAYTVIGH